MNKFFLILIILTILSCKHNGKRNNVEEENAQANDSLQVISLTDPSDLKIEDIIDSVRYVQLETNMECLISNIRKIEVSDNRFFIQDDKGMAIYIFDINGKFLAKISNQGRGPREYIKISEINFDQLNKKLIVSDCFSNKVFIYKPDGNLEKVFKVNFEPYNVVSLGKQLFANLYSHNKEYTDNQILKNYDLQIFDSLGKMITGRIKNKTPLSINITTSNSAAQSADGSILYAPILSDTVYHISCSTKVTPKYVFKNNTSNLKNISESMIPKICHNEQQRILMQLLERNYLFYNGTLFDSPMCLIAEFGFKDKHKRLIYSKNNKTSILYDVENIKGDKIIKYITKYIIAQQNNTFYSQHAPTMLKLTSKIENFPNGEIHEFINNLDESNNPIIFSFKMREF